MLAAEARRLAREAALAEQERKDSGAPRPRTWGPSCPPGFHVWQQYVEKQTAKPKRGSGAGGKAGVGALRR